MEQGKDQLEMQLVEEGRLIRLKTAHRGVKREGVKA
jgi:hypothetical protein